MLPEQDMLTRGSWGDLEAPEEVLAVPTMLSPQERALLYALARDHAGGEGAISTQLCKAELRREVDDHEKLTLIDWAIARNDGGSAEMVTLSKAALLFELGRERDAHDLVNAVEADTGDPSELLCIEAARAQLADAPWPRWIGRLRRRG